MYECENIKLEKCTDVDLLKCENVYMQQCEDVDLAKCRNCRVTVAKLDKFGLKEVNAACKNVRSVKGGLMIDYS